MGSPMAPDMDLLAMATPTMELMVVVVMLSLTLVMGLLATQVPTEQATMDPMGNPISQAISTLLLMVWLPTVTNQTLLIKTMVMLKEV